jgi:predicted ribosome quality control (RQC) complex YloA/Tae2 family protein
MLIDSLQLTALSSELGKMLKGSRIDKIYQPTKELILFDMFPCPQGLRLALSTNRLFGFAGLIGSKPPNPPSPLTFCSLLRNRLKSAILIDIIPAKTDRIICFVLSAKREDEIEKFYLQLRLTGNKPNLLLFNETGEPVGKLHNYSEHSGPVKLDRDFLTMEEESFTPPISPPYAEQITSDRNQITPVPSQKTESVAAIGQQILEIKSSMALCQAIPGLTPNLAELILNSCESSDQRLAMANWLSDALSGKLPLNTYLVSNSLSGKKFLFPYGRPPFLPLNTTVEEKGSFLSEVEDFYFNGLVRNEYKISKGRLLKLLTDTKKKLTRKICQLRDGLESSKTAEQYTHQGEILKSVLYKIRRGTKSVTAFDWMNNKDVEIPVDPRISPQGNLEKYFNKARKIKRTLPILKQQIEETASQLVIITNILTETYEAAEISRINELEAKLEMVCSSSKKGKLKLRKKGDDKTKIRPAKVKKDRRKILDGLRTFKSSDGLKIYVGRNGRENAYLSGKFLQKKDLWFHIRDDSGPHVVVKLGPKSECPGATKLEAAQLAVYFSSKRYEKSVQVTYCRGFEVKTVPGGKPGLVSLRNYSCMTVIPDSGIMKKVIPIELQ